jgi:hypothetical protein
VLESPQHPLKLFDHIIIMLKAQAQEEVAQKN